MSEQEKVQLAYDLMRMDDDGGACCEMYSLELEVIELEGETLDEMRREARHFNRRIGQ